MPRARKKPKKLEGVKSVDKSKPIDGTVDHGVKTHFKMQVEHRTDGVAFLRAIDRMRTDDGELPAKAKRLLEKAQIPVPGARASSQTENKDVEGDVNGRQLRRIVHPLEAMERKGLISRAEYTAGMRLSDAWEKTNLSPSKDLSEVRVDTSRSVGGAEGGLAATQLLGNITRLLPNEARAVCHHVCCTQRFLRDGFSRNNREMAVHVEALRMGLAVVADASSRGFL